jgi:hypothetical protein
MKCEKHHDQIVALIHVGGSYNTISKVINCSIAALYKYVKSKNLSTINKQCKADRDLSLYRSPDDIVLDFCAGMTRLQLVKKYHRSEKAIDSHLRRYKIIK